MPVNVSFFEQLSAMSIIHQEAVHGERVTFTAADRSAVRSATGCEVSIRARNNGPRLLRITGHSNEQVQLARQCVLEIITGRTAGPVAGSLALLW